MTIIARQNDFLFTDSKWLNEECDRVSIEYGKVKAFRHPSNKAVIAYSGTIDTFSLFNAVNSMVTEVIQNISEYGSKLLISEETLDFLKEAVNEESTFIVITKDINVVVTLRDKEFSINVTRKSKLLYAGSGGVYIQHLGTLNKFIISDINSVGKTFNLIKRKDPCSGGVGYLINLEDMEAV